MTQRFGEADLFFADDGERAATSSAKRLPSPRERLAAICTLGFALILFSLLLFTPHDSPEAQTAPMDLDEAMTTSSSHAQQNVLTQSKFEYNEMDIANRRYMIVNPSSNALDSQVLDLENAMGLAKRLNRTLYVPLIRARSKSLMGAHSTLPANHLFDFNLLSRYCRVIPLNVTTEQFLHAFAKMGTVQEVTSARHSHRDSDSPLLVFTERKAAWLDRVNREAVKQYVSYAPPLRALAASLVRQHLPSKFYAIHLKSGTTTAQMFLSRQSMQTQWPGDKEDVPLFVASQPLPPLQADVLQTLRAVFKTILTLQDLDKELGVFRSQAPMHFAGMMDDVLERLICAQAAFFEGTPLSATSEDIARLRKHRAVLFPEAV